MKTRAAFILFLTVIITIAAGSAFGAYGGGSGTAADPYKIATKTHLLALAATTGDYGKCFILTADVNMTAQVFSVAIIAADGSLAFTGTFDGNGHKIVNFTINTNNYDHGLFGTITGGSVKNLGIENCSVIGYYAGCLVGFNSSGTISNCYSTGSVSCGSSSASAGNLVGENWGTISDCYSTGSVSGAASSYYIGGLVGRNEGTVSTCYATGSVAGGAEMGGLVGSNGGNITNCYSASAVSGSQYLGGLVGINYSTISNCYSTGAVSGSYDLGGLVGSQSGASTVNSFWNTQTSGQTTSAGGTGKTTAQMKTLSTFASAGWDFVGIWGIEENQTYPYLPALPGDLNHDKKVDFKDFAIFASHWLQQN
ncbi:MAG: GLUG motif-containing protein [Sedimentisphaerales bacterium]|jgi:hypothetical protein